MAKYKFNQQSATLKLREPINEGRVMFTIDDENIDQLFNNKFEADVDYLRNEQDVYYVTNQNDLERFVDYVESSGLDADSIKIYGYFNEEGSVTGGEAYLPAMNVSSKKQNPFKENVQEYFIQVDVRDARTALAIIDDSSYLSNNIKKRASDVYTTVDPIAAEEFVDALKQNGINSKNNVEGYIDEDVLSGYKQDKNFRPGHTKDKGGFQYKDLWAANEAYTPSTTNAEELARVEALLAKAHEDKAYSVMSSYEFRIKMLRLLVGLEKKHSTTLPLFKFGLMVDDYIRKHFPGFKGKFGPYNQNWKSMKDHIEQSISQKQDINEENIEEAYIPDNIKKFAKQKGVSNIVSQVARWSEKMGKRIVGGTAIGKNYSTLILDLTYQGGEIRINTDTDEIEVKDDKVYDYNSFVKALGGESMNENIERDQKVKITRGTYAGNTAIVHDFDSEKDTASGDDWVDVLIGSKKEMKTVKASELKPINENYSRFRNETKTRSGSEQYHQAVKLVRKKVQEIAKLHNYMERMQKELSETQDGLKKKKYTEMAIQKIKAEVKELNMKIRKLK